MPPSPAMRYSLGKEARGDGRKRRHSLESGILLRGKDDDLALFNEMQTRERDSFLLQSSDDLEDSFATRLRHLSDVNVGISIPSQRGTSDLLNIDGDNDDYNWLLTPLDTPLFPSMDEDPPFTNVTSRGRRSKSISISKSSTMEKSCRSSRGSASPNRLSPSPRSGTNTSQAGGRPSSLPNYSPTSSSLRYATPTRRSSPPPNKTYKNLTGGGC
ncbi:unnamed protein product [Lathyrus sativus]|nr:unnamed protein product [Lathyrus sativus]